MISLFDRLTDYDFVFLYVYSYAYFHLLFQDERYVVQVSHNEKVRKLEIALGKSKYIVKK